MSQTEASFAASIETEAAADEAPEQRLLDGDASGVRDVSVVPRRRVASPALLVGWVVPLLLLALWKVASDRGWAPPQILPSPGFVLDTLIEQARSDLAQNAGISLGRVAGGFALGGSVGVVFGLAMGLWPRFEDYALPLFRAVSQVPVLGWLPLAMMVLGIGEPLKVVIIAHASLVPVAINTHKGVRSVPGKYVDVARAFEFSYGQLLRKVVLPGAVPSIFTGIRHGLTQAWLSLVTVELLASSEGLGFLIVWGRQLFQLDLVLAAILVVGVVGLVLDKTLARIEAWLLRWRAPEAGVGGA
jgi:sulfonate transport system permease protein